MARRRKRSPEKENHERWLLTYSDMITLLLIFFIVMYSITSINISKFHELAESLNQAMGSSNTVINTNAAAGGQQLLTYPQVTPSDAQVAEAAAAEQAKFDALYKRLEAYLKKNHLQADVQAAQEIPGIKITLRDSVLFANGSDVLSPQAMTILLGLVPFLQTVSHHQIVVEGYTDNVPIRTLQYPNNWFLSVSRAAEVVSNLVQDGISPYRISAEGFSKYREVASNVTSTGRELNRRVNIVILKKYPYVKA
jgi:chemotaxis protein MotB